MTHYYYGTSGDDNPTITGYDSWYMYGYGGDDILVVNNLTTTDYNDYFDGGSGNDTIHSNTGKIP